MHSLTANYCRCLLLWVACETQGTHLLAANYCISILLRAGLETQDFASLLWFVSGGRTELYASGPNGGYGILNDFAYGKKPDENSGCHMRHNKKISPRKMRREIESVFMKELSV
jgi:hypothetical protein